MATSAIFSIVCLIVLRSTVFSVVPQPAFAAPASNSSKTSDADDVDLALQHSGAMLRSLFDSWNVKHGKYYSPSQASEEQKRFEIFKDNFFRVEAHNRRMIRSDSTASFKLGLNRFADLTNDEFKESRQLGLRYISRTGPNRHRRSFIAAAASPKLEYGVNDVGRRRPESVDWRSLGAVTPPKDQGKCGSCWAFSAVGAIEGVNAIATGKLISVSEQELVTCDTGGYSNGCHGGMMDDAFEWVISNGGIASEDRYPYESRNGESGVCNTELQKEEKDVTIDDYVDVEPYSEAALMDALVHRPVSVGIEASSMDFQLYAEGVYNGSCSNDPYDVNHGVLVVGYGTENGVNYWIVKNSWGSAWGDEGFIRILRDGSPFGMCSIHSIPSYPVKYTSPAVTNR